MHFIFHCVRYIILRISIPQNCNSNCNDCVSSVDLLHPKIIWHTQRPFAIVPIHCNAFSQMIALRSRIHSTFIFCRLQFDDDVLLFSRNFNKYRRLRSHTQYKTHTHTQHTHRPITMPFCSIKYISFHNKSVLLEHIFIYSPFPFITNNNKIETLYSVRNVWQSDKNVVQLAANEASTTSSFLLWYSLFFDAWTRTTLFLFHFCWCAFRVGALRPCASGRFDRLSF